MNEIPIEKIKPSTTNPRQDLGDLTELADSIKKSGLLQPIIVKKENDYYKIIVGMRRFEASKLANLETIPCIISEYDEEDAVIDGLIENIHREDLTWAEEAIAFKKLVGKQIPVRDEKGQYLGTKIIEGKSIGDIADLISKSRTYVSHRLNAYEILELFPQASILPYTFCEEIRGFVNEDWELLVKKTIKENLTQKELRQIKNNYKMVMARFELIGKDNPLYKILYDFWYPLRYKKTSYKDMEEEISVREGTAKKREWYYPVEKITEEQAKELAKEQMGEYLGTITGTFHRVFGVYKTVDQIRRKWVEEEE